MLLPESPDTFGSRTRDLSLDDAGKKEIHPGRPIWDLLNDIRVPPMDETQLRDNLLQTVARSEHSLLAELCVAHADAISRHFACWSQPSPGDRTDSDAWETRIGGLYAVAKVFANHLSNADLLRGLLNAGEPSELALWERKLTEAMQLMRSCQFAEATAILSDQLIDTRKLTGHGHLHLSATTHWYLSQVQWMSQNRNEAIGHAERSLQITRRINDDPKYISRYLQHLYQVHHYFGEAADAAKYADAAGEFLAASEPERTRYYRSQSKLLRGPGEPLTRVVVWIGQARYELDELPSLNDVQMNLVIERNRQGWQVTDLLVQQGQVARNEDRFDDALGLFRQAHAIDPYDPVPMLNQAFLFAYAERYVESIECFEEVERLSPGWNSSRTGLWLVQRLLGGEYPHELLSQAMAIGSLNAADPETLEVIHQAIKRYPNLSLFRLEEARCRRVACQTAELEAALRRGREGEGDVDVRTRLLLELGQVCAGEEREAFLRQAVELNGSLVAATVAKLMLTDLLTRRV